MVNAAGAIGAVLFPEDCRLCQRALTRVSRVPVCERCLESVPRLEAEHFCEVCQAAFLNRYAVDEENRCRLCRSGRSWYDAVFSYGWHEGSLRELIHLFKYDQIATLARPLAGFLLRAVPGDRQFDGVVAVPMHWRKLMQRGFNQSGLLAADVAKEWGLPVIDAVRRVSAGQVQATLSAAERRRSLAGVYRAAEKAGVAGKSLLLVDDVMTTGSTGQVCAKVLKAAGAARVTVVTVARVDRRSMAFPAALSREAAQQEEEQERIGL